MLRKPKFWVISAVLLVVLALVGDRGAQFALERVVAGQIQDALATPSKPSVDLGGFPILAELIAQKLDRVEVDIRNGDAGKVRFEHVHAVLTGVKQQGGGIQADSISGGGLVGYAAISASAKPLKVGFGGDGLVEVTAAVKVLGQDYSASAAGRPRIDGSTLVIKPAKVTSNTGGDAGALAKQIPEVRIKLRDIPAGLKIVLNPTEAGVEFSFIGEDVFLSSTDSTDSTDSTALDAPVAMVPSETFVSPGETTFTRPRTAT